MNVQGVRWSVVLCILRSNIISAFQMPEFALIMDRVCLQYVPHTRMYVSMCMCHPNMVVNLAENDVLRSYTHFLSPRWLMRSWY